MECTDENTTESEASTSASNGPKIKDEGEMTKENTLYLISLVKSYGCLWNEKDPDFENDQTKADAWQRISEAMGRSEKELKTKWDSMHSCFVTCHAKNLSNIIKHKWFAYNALRFLESKLAHDEPKEPEQTIEEDSSDVNDATVRDEEDPPEPALVNVGNVGNNSVAEKSSDKPTIEKVTKVAPLIYATPQNQSLLMANGSAQNVPPTRTHAPVRVKRLVPARSAQDPLRIERRVVPAQAQGQPAVTAATNPSTVKSFLNLLEHELNALSADYATMAQVEIYRIIGEFKLKDVNRGHAKSIQLKTAQPVPKVHQVQSRVNKMRIPKTTPGHQWKEQPKKIITVNHPIPIVTKTEHTSPHGSDNNLEVLMECEEA
ncbi:AGAP012073-PA-like protein [Anopheles sinensis]|uniref:AGAP012073-PA-like protein n=1 Tax=Anopheles sinensis TaxID=74873 RepID=A0A084W9C3_ANOSI|nr:AGAP012073-PA-like protein [Anopheles sinensis]